MTETIIRRYRVRGVVQGVGFRPLVHRLARSLELAGWVLNDAGGVVIEAHGTVTQLDRFAAALQRDPPPAAVIASVEVEDVGRALEAPAGFEIRESAAGAAMQTLVPPDLSVCCPCHRELLDPENRRFGYPFINCTDCGPRYSIIERMPYDRPATTMAPFTMCPECAAEYGDVESRRYHAQPNACPTCGPSLTLCDATGAPAGGGDPLRAAIAALRTGRILAVKSLGGFHLAVDASDAAAVAELRRRKRRDAKPFAIMVRDLDVLARIAAPTDVEVALMQSAARPITLVRKRRGALPETIAPGNPDLGVMLPSTPLHHLLLADEALPVLVMTSGNISRHPIEHTNAGALEKLAGVADLFLMNDRDIRTRVDDSILRTTRHEALARPVVTFVRRARGYAPYPVQLPAQVRPVLAFGAELKSTIALSRGREVFLSQHIGDLDRETTLAAHADAIEHLGRLLEASPDLVACDLHPQFNSAEAAVRARRAPVVRVQHHHAHMAACMAENGIAGEPAIGVVFDGTGYGTDGTIWGGEFLVGDCAGFRRAAHLRPFPLLGGDAAVREPYRVAWALVLDAFGAGERPPLAFQQHLSEGRGELLARMAASGVRAYPATSMGRLFDGVSSILGVRHVIEYEAQAAIELEALLDRGLTMGEELPVDLVDRPDGVVEIDHRPLVRALVDAMARSGDAPALSRRFHSTIVELVARVCRRLRDETGVAAVVLSGGVFMNEFLLANCIVALRRAGLVPHWHQMVPPNDGGLALGQVVVADAVARSAQPGPQGEAR